MAKRGPPCKIDEVLTSGRWAGKTRAEAAIAMRRRGARHRHCAGAAGTTRETLINWLNDYPEFFTAFTGAEAEGVEDLLLVQLSGTVPAGMLPAEIAPALDARDASRAATDALRGCYAYYHTVPDDEGDATPNQDALSPEAIDALVALLAAKNPHKLRMALERAGMLNREPEAVGEAK